MFGVAPSHISRTVNSKDKAEPIRLSEEQRRANAREASRKHRDENRDSILARRRELYDSRKECQRGAEYRARNRPRLREYYKHYDKTVRDWDRARKLARDRYAADPVKQIQHRADVKAWRQANPDKADALSKRNCRRWYARRVGAEGDGWGELWPRVVEAWNSRCAYCQHNPAEAAEHIVPLSRGGTNLPSNIVPACTFCNSQKGAKLLSEWRPDLEKAMQLWSARCRQFDKK